MAVTTQTQRYALAAVVALSGLVVFQFFGNTVRGYIDTGSLFVWWFSQWFNPASETEHGPIIALVSLWLLWRNLQADKPGDASPRPGRGLALIAVAFVLHLLGAAIGQARVSAVAFLLYLDGAAWLLGGRRWGRAAAFPCAFMLLSLPLEFLFDEFGFHLRLAVIDAATGIAHGLGIDVIRNGTQLLAPDGSFAYDVAPACSGIRSLVALTALCTLLGYLHFKAWWRRGLFFLVSFPFAYLGNVIRILAIIVAAEWFGQRAGEVVHAWFGFLIFVVVLGLALGLSAALKKWLPEENLTQRRKGAKLETVSSEKNSAPLRLCVKKSILLAVVIVLSATLTCLGVVRLTQGGQSGGTLIKLTADGQPAPFPSLLGLDWAGRRYDVTAVEREVLPPDTGFARTYYQSLEDRNVGVLVSVVLSGADRGSIHRPEICLAGQGWSVIGRFDHTFDAPGFPEGIPATVLRTERKSLGTDGQEAVVPGLFAYFFVGDDIILATHSERMALSATDKLLRHKAHRWAYVFAQTDCPDGENAGLERLQAVLGEALPAVLNAPVGREQAALR